ncbi:sugar transferase [uncultured Polaribacter sp.]|uniref:sugar transferase n=1 Tax=uncultured Polaribacter sp. TaxID=174711 RepID=UPI00259B1432|nr:sugar transferase [uncultured Polaribacter sp.]
MFFLKEREAINYSMTKYQKVVKRFFDFLLSLILIPILLFPLFVLITIATIDLRVFGLFCQKRIGKYGKEFTIFKIKTLKKDKKTTKISKFFRKSKLDELPQIFNVFLGNMSFVGPRPDLKEVIFQTIEIDDIILSIKPGITGPASLYFFNEEDILSKVENSIEYNLTVIQPKKNKINRDYINNYHIFNDIKIIFKTLKNVI